MNFASTSTGPLPRDSFLDQFFSRLPEEMQTDFTNRQIAALKSVFGEATRSGHGFNIRLSLPTPLIGRGIYIVMLGGSDRRGGQADGRARARSGWRGLVALGKLVVGALFVIQLLFMAITLAIWLV